MSAGRCNISAWLHMNYSVTPQSLLNHLPVLTSEESPQNIKKCHQIWCNTKKQKNNQMSDNDRKREMTDVNTGAAGGAIYIL